MALPAKEKHRSIKTASPASQGDQSAAYKRFKVSYKGDTSKPAGDVGRWAFESLNNDIMMHHILIVVCRYNFRQEAIRS
jgi:hypothetical protein